MPRDPRLAGNSLADAHPAVAEEWHPTLNGDLTPNDVTKGASAVVWWQCPEAGHAYQMIVSGRTGKKWRRCPTCVRVGGKKMRVKNPLDEHRPEIAAYWDHAANLPLTPSDVSAFDSRIVQWRCPEGPDHVWSRSVKNMQRARCPYCANKWVSVTNSLATVEPALAAEWHPTLNGDLTANDVLPGAGRKVWWQCPDYGHAYEATPNRRTNPNYRARCSVCIAEFGPELPSGRHLTRPKGLGKKVADYPLAMALWASDLNGNTDPAAVPGVLADLAWWRCEHSALHVWQNQIRWMCRAAGPTGCPFCAGRSVAADNTLAALHPELAGQWHPTRNGESTPADVTLIDAPPVWWKCDVAPDHEWRAKVYSRAVMGHGCPACSGKQLSVTNRLDLTHPYIAAEFNSVRNRITPDHVKYGAPARYWWTCRHCQHEWRTSVEKRTKSGQGCPECAVYNVSKEELFLAHEIAAFLPVDFSCARLRDATGKAWRVDVVIPEHRLIVEYDGSYWHSDRLAKDTEKTAALTAAGWTVLRVREQPLSDLVGVWQVHSRPERYVETAATVITALAQRGLIDQTRAEAYSQGGALVARDAALAAIEARATKRSARRRSMSPRQVA